MKNSSVIEDDIAKNGLQTAKDTTDFFTKTERGHEVIWDLIKESDKEESLKPSI